jgi:alkanesulfonate monooxygenase SsuD/methylene tetrahydromethanopterin reductase-like flavin-dependent oxidoreductase (luciferase family)
MCLRLLREGLRVPGVELDPQTQPTPRHGEPPPPELPAERRDQDVAPGREERPGGDRVTIPIAARQADVWHCFSPLEELPAKIRVLEEHARQAGRDPAAIGRATNLSISEPWNEVRERGEALRDLGFGCLVVP